MSAAAALAGRIRAQAKREWDAAVRAYRNRDRDARWSGFRWALLTVRHATARSIRLAGLARRGRRRAKQLREAGIRAHRRRGFRDAQDALARAAELDPGDLTAWHYLADAQAQLGEAQDARRTLHSLVPLDHHPTRQLSRIGRLALSVGEVDLALRIVDTLRDREPNDHEVVELAALAAREAEGLDRGLAIAEQAAGSGEAGPLAASIRLFLEFGRCDRALAMLPAAGFSDSDLALGTARGLRRHGFLSQALRALEGADSDPGVERQRKQISAQLRILQEGWRPPAPRALKLQPLDGRILHIAHSSLPHAVSGYTIRTQHVALAQRAVGLDPHVLTQAGFPRGQSGGDGDEVVEGITYHRLPHADPTELPRDEWLSLNVDHAAGVVEWLRPAVLHPASDFHNPLIALSLREAADIPVVYEVRGFWEETWLSRQQQGAAESDSYTGRSQTEVQCMLDADHVVTLGETMKRHMVGRGVPAEKVTIVPNAVDADLFRRRDREGGSATRIGIDPEDTVIGYLGSLLNYEGLDDLVRAVGLLAERRDDVRCLIVGDGPERGRLEELAADAGFADRVVFTGPVSPDQAPGYYGLMDLFVLPRLRHRVCELVTPLKPFEAMAAECAVVVSDLEPLMEIVSDGETGVVTPAGDARALAEALEGLVDDPVRRRSLATTAREWVLEERTWGRSAQMYRSVYEAVS